MIYLFLHLFDYTKPYLRKITGAASMAGIVWTLHIFRRFHGYDNALAPHLLYGMKRSASWIFSAKFFWQNLICCFGTWNLEQCSTFPVPPHYLKEKTCWHPPKKSAPTKNIFHINLYRCGEKKYFLEKIFSRVCVIFCKTPFFQLYIIVMLW